MTKYVLHGGGESVVSEANARFFRESVSGLSGRIDFLCVYFAKEKDLGVWNWDALFEQDRQQIAAACPDEQVRCHLASDNLEAFVEQVRGSHVVFLRGGLTAVLTRSLSAVPALERAWKGKVVAGASAGALALARYYYDDDLGGYREGLGILPLKLICHWGPGRLGKLEGLRSFGDPDLDVVTIPEQEYVVCHR